MVSHRINVAPTRLHAFPPRPPPLSPPWCPCRGTDPVRIWCDPRVSSRNALQERCLRVIHARRYLHYHIWFAQNRRSNLLPEQVGHHLWRLPCHRVGRPMLHRLERDVLRLGRLPRDPCAVSRPDPGAYSSCAFTRTDSGPGPNPGRHHPRADAGTHGHGNQPWQRKKPSQWFPSTLASTTHAALTCAKQCTDVVSPPPPPSSPPLPPPHVLVLATRLTHVRAKHARSLSFRPYPTTPSTPVPHPSPTRSATAP